MKRHGYSANWPERKRNEELSIQTNNHPVSPTFHTIKWNIVDRIGHLVLNQPPSNTMTLLFFREMAELMDVIIHLQELKGIVIYGNGRHYSSGADLDELLREIAGERKAEQFLRTNYRALSYFEELPVPVISAIRGVCLGSAFELALFSHFRFCGEDAVFALPETTFNLIPGVGGIQRFARHAGNARALDYILTGRTFDATAALELGLTDQIWPKKEVIERAIEFAQNLPEKYSCSMRKVYLRRFVNRET